MTTLPQKQDTHHWYVLKYEREAGVLVSVLSWLLFHLPFILHHHPSSYVQQTKILQSWRAPATHFLTTRKVNILAIWDPSKNQAWSRFFSGFKISQSHEMSFLKCSICFYSRHTLQLDLKMKNCDNSSLI